MSRVMTFSRTFPAYHQKAGDPTYFVEKLSEGLWDRKDPELLEFYEDMLVQKNNKLWNSHQNIITDFYFNLDWKKEYIPKHHTIRAGNNWKVGDKFRPRVWSGKPYNSPQITIAPDIEIVKVWKFDCDIEGVFYLDGKWIDVTSTELPKNDGLNTDDLLDWFPVGKIFSGQILCWNKDIEY